MLEIMDVCSTDFGDIPIDEFWNKPSEKEIKMHRIHSYPAKFPAFITSKAFEHAKDEGRKLERVADIFCGCGTVALEARRNSIDFWGCDINPVATLIARAKSQKYTSAKLSKYQEIIENKFRQLKKSPTAYSKANDRLKYWFKEEQFTDLDKLKRSIEKSVPINSRYRLLFLCAFSNILKSTSMWLQKSIKPQLDPNKNPPDALKKFQSQCAFIKKAIAEDAGTYNSSTIIHTRDCLTISDQYGTIDMIVSSPPYVTSYEYADLHQLSSLWLGMTDDYRTLRKGTIGSIHQDYDFPKSVKLLNQTGTKTVFELYDKDKSKAQSVAKYYLDVQKAAKVCFDLLTPSGLALFVIGDTEYRGVRMNNAKHLAESLEKVGFKRITSCRRKITGKILTPYRTKDGKFTSDPKARKVYSEEYVVVGYTRHRSIVPSVSTTLIKRFFLSKYRQRNFSI